MLRRTAFLILAGLLLATPLACGPRNSASPSGGGKTISPAPAVPGEWRLTTLRAQDLAGPAAERPPTMTITDDGQVGGFSGVNRWSSTLDTTALADGGLSLGPITTTLMAGQPDAMKLEHEFLEALREARRFDEVKLQKGELSLLAEDGQELLRFVRAG